MYPDNSGSYCKGVAFRGNVLVPHENSQLTPWPISVTVLAFNMLMLYPTYKWSRFSLVSALWAVISSVISLWRVLSAKQGPMSVAFNMPFNLPLTIGSNIIKLTREDGRKGFRGRWKTFFKTIKGKSPQYTDEESHHQDDDQNRESNQIYDRYHRYEEISRLLALIVAFITMLWGIVRVWEWWFPFDAINDRMCLASFRENIHASTELPTCGFVITAWKNVDYTNCVEFEPAVGWFLIIVYTSICVATFVGIFVMRGYFIWALGGVGAAILIVIARLQSAYSTNSYCVEFVAKLMGIPPLTPQILSHQSLINLWWHRNGFKNWLINLQSWS
ncbi:unnamed protein product [Rhizophagus irregularis]|nr:unnamed protein product [Rhizophagus irregularis]